MEWKSMKLKDLIYKPISGEWGKEITNMEDGNIVKVIRTANFTNEGIIDYDDIVLRNISVKKVEQKKLLYGDILVEKSGGTDKNPVGRVVFYDKNDGIYLSNNFTSIFRAKKDKIYNRFLFYYLFYNYNRGGMIRYYNKTTGIQNLKVNDLIKELQIPVPPMEIQKKIVEVLDETQKLIDNRKKQIELLDDLIESIFYDMFGDPVKNDKGWEVKKLGELGSLKNGINYSKEDKGYTIKCLGVGDFKSLLEINDSSRLSEIKLGKEPEEDYLLKDGDIVFVRSNGNRELVGRNIAIYPKNELVTFSGFCIRFRIIDKNIISNFLNYALHTKTLKKQLLCNIRGANIQNLNQKMLKNLEVPIPPLPLQNQFAEKVQAIKKQKGLLQESLKLMEDNYNSLMQRAFKGELF